MRHKNAISQKIKEHIMVSSPNPELRNNGKKNAELTFYPPSQKEKHGVPDCKLHK
jgi:hypothetical protein